MKKFLLLIIVFVFIGTMIVATACEEKPSEPHVKVVDPIDDNYRVFYEIFVGSFSDGNGDRVGDLRGIINRMDYLNDGDITAGNDLGVQGLWLSPIFSSPSYHKYDCMDYYKIATQFGTEADLVELLNLCHERNVKVILDLVINHTSNQHPWFKAFTEARKNRDYNSEYYDFYTCVTKDTQVPGRTYAFISGTQGEYYECNFDTGMPELNFDNAAVRQAVLDVAKYWLDRGVDGFRFDAVKYVYFGDDPTSAEFWQWYMDELRKIKPDIYTVAECWSGDAETMTYYPAMDCFNFQVAQREGQIGSAVRTGRVSTFASYIERYLNNISELREGAMLMPFLSNHDMDRIAGSVILSDRSMHMMANLYILCSGSPFLYYGEEIGMKGYRGAASTDANRRLAMLWGDDDTVRNPTGSTYSADKQTNGTVASQRADSNSLFNYYAKLIAFRNSHPMIARGDYEALPNIGTGFGGFVITYEGEQWGLIHNVSEEEVQIDLSKYDVAFTAVIGYIGQGAARIENGKLIIAPHTSVVLQ